VQLTCNISQFKWGLRKELSCNDTTITFEITLYIKWTVPTGLPCSSIITVLCLGFAYYTVSCDRSHVNVNILYTHPHIHELSYNLWLEQISSSQHASLL